MHQQFIDPRGGSLAVPEHVLAAIRTGQVPAVRSKRATPPGGGGGLGSPGRDPPPPHPEALPWARLVDHLFVVMRL